MRTDFRIEYDAPSGTVSELYGALIGRTVDLDVSHEGYPHANVHVLRTDSDGDVVVCETDDDGIPIDNATWAIPQDVIRRVIVPLGNHA